ncbi:hypothetical protein [Paenibacillus alvei]|uniref:hypothetical protein n=1 Tax=Paenibacillus alvei TaxID=44250 RepID=UPI00227FBFAE|nr:hypothetical protein [Paenibacillus alvei]MCY7485794.1 hypothetical protein [Paenibacillus alvei]
MIPDKGHGKIVLHHNEDGSLQLRDNLSMMWCACGGAAVEYYAEELPQYQFKCIKCSYKYRKESEVQRLGEEVERLKVQLQEAHNVLLELDKWYNDGVCTWEPHCPPELAAIWRRAASVRQRIQGQGGIGEREQELKSLLHRILSYTSKSEAYTDSAHIHYWIRSTLKNLYGEEEI